MMESISTFTFDVLYLYNLTMHQKCYNVNCIYKYIYKL